MKEDFIQTFVDLFNELIRNMERIGDELQAQTSALESFEECMVHIAKALESFNEKTDDFVKKTASTLVATLQREITPSPLSSSPDKDEESTKEGEINPSIISPSFPRENCRHGNARKCSKKSSKTDPEELERLKQSFDEFWEAYGYKRNKKKAWLAWQAQTFGWKNRKAAFEGIAAYKADCKAFGRAMCHAVTYLNQRRWEDDFNQGLEQSTDYIDAERRKRNIITGEDRRKREVEQRMQGFAALAAEYQQRSNR